MDEAEWYQIKAPNYSGRNGDGPIPQYYKMTDSPKVSKEAVKIYFNELTDDFYLKNINRNTILVNRKPVPSNTSVPLFHRTLI